MALLLGVGEAEAARPGEEDSQDCADLGKTERHPIAMQTHQRKQKRGGRQGGRREGKDKSI